MDHDHGKSLAPNPAQSGSATGNQILRRRRLLILQFATTSSFSPLVKLKHEVFGKSVPDCASPAHAFRSGLSTVDPKEKRILVSDRIKTEFENGREYYKLRGEALALPENTLAIPSIENLNYHAEHLLSRLKPFGELASRQ
jgi:hypothetical protein